MAIFTSRVWQSSRSLGSSPISSSLSNNKGMSETYSARASTYGPEGNPPQGDCGLICYDKCMAGAEPVICPCSHIDTVGHTTASDYPHSGRQRKASNEHDAEN